MSGLVLMVVLVSMVVVLGVAWVITHLLSEITRLLSELKYYQEMYNLAVAGWEDLRAKWDDKYSPLKAENNPSITSVCCKCGKEDTVLRFSRGGSSGNKYNCDCGVDRIIITDDEDKKQVEEIKENEKVTRKG